MYFKKNLPLSLRDSKWYIFHLYISLKDTTWHIWKTINKKSGVPGSCLILLSDLGQVLTSQDFGVCIYIKALESLMEAGVLLKYQ